MASFGTCADCGRRVRGNYVRCYRCNAHRRRSNWHDPEHLENLEKRDTELGRSEFYVYVLDTDYGHYVGHTANVRARLGAHIGGDVESTAGGQPKLLWRSYPLATREEAARFEAALKSLRDQQAERFQEITGYAPRPFHRVPALHDTQRVRVRSQARPRPRRGPIKRDTQRDDMQRGGCVLFGIIAIVAIVAIVLFNLAT